MEYQGTVLTGGSGARLYWNHTSHQQAVALVLRQARGLLPVPHVHAGLTARYSAFKRNAISV